MRTLKHAQLKQHMARAAMHALLAEQDLQRRREIDAVECEANAPRPIFHAFQANEHAINRNPTK